MAHKGKLFGYARVSSEDQSLDIQLDELRKAGVNDALIFREKASGTTRQGRQELARLLALIGPGDTLVCMRLDRLARSMRDFSNIIDELQQIGAGIKCTKEDIDATGPMGMLVMNILAAVAAFETGRRRERQMEGVAKAKAAGKFKGRKRVTTVSDVAEAKGRGLGPTAISRELKCSVRTVYRYLDSATGAAA